MGLTSILLLCLQAVTQEAFPSNTTTLKKCFYNISELLDKSRNVGFFK